MSELTNQTGKTEFLLYTTEDGRIRVETRMQDDTVWLTQDQMATLFDKAKSTINEHIKNLFEEGELDESLVTRKFGNSEFSTKPIMGSKPLRPAESQKTQRETTHARS